jgi:hypothetical protein
MIQKNLVFGAAALVAFAAIPARAETPEQQYQDQMQRYRDQQSQYQQQRNDYDRRLEGYEYDRAHPYTWWRSAYFHAAPDWYFRYRGDDEILGAEVAERDGRRVGEVVDVEHAPSGRVDRIQVQLDRQRVVWLDVSHVRYDRSDRIAFVDLGVGDLYDRSNYRP